MYLCRVCAVSLFLTVVVGVSASKGQGRFARWTGPQAAHMPGASSRSLPLS